MRRRSSASQLRSRPPGDGRARVQPPAAAELRQLPGRVALRGDGRVGRGARLPGGQRLPQLRRGLCRAPRGADHRSQRGEGPQDLRHRGLEPLAHRARRRVSARRRTSLPGRSRRQSTRPTSRSPPISRRSARTSADEVQPRVRRVRRGDGRMAGRARRLPRRGALPGRSSQAGIAPRPRLEFTLDHRRSGCSMCVPGAASRSCCAAPPSTACERASRSWRATAAQWTARWWSSRQLPRARR